MWNRRKKVSNRRVCPGRERKGRRLGLEALERRDCPAVQAFFMQGVLTVTGDEGPNDIEFVQRNDGVVDLLGDGERHTFEGVNKIVARTGGGDDRVNGKIVLWVRDVDPNPSPNTLPFFLDLDMGAGNDTARIEDDILITFRDLNDPRIRNLVTTHSMYAHVDLGTGADELVLQMEYHDIVNVDVDSADSFDSVQVGVHHPLPMPIRLIEARKATVELNLAGGEHTVDVQTQGVDVVDLNIVVYGGRAPSDPSGNNTIYISASGGGVWKTAVEVDGDDNLVDVSTEDIDEVDLGVIAAGGSNAVQVVGRGTGDLVGIDFRPSCVISLDFAGDGGNVVGVSTDGFADVNVDASISGDGNEVEIYQQGRILVGTDQGIWTSSTNLILTGDRNEVGFKSDGYDQVGFDLDMTGNGSQAEIGLLLPAVQKVRAAAARINVNLGRGGNLLNATTDGYDDVTLELSEGATPTSATTTIGVSPTSFSFSATACGANPSAPAIVFVGGWGASSYQYATVSSRIDFDGPIGASVEAAIELTDGPDSLTIATNNVHDLDLGIDANAGNDHVELDIVNDDNSPTPATVYAVLNLAEGNDTLSFIAEAASVILEVHGGEGDDIIKIGDGEPRGDQGYSGSHVLYQDIFIPLGTGSDRVIMDLISFEVANVKVHSADGFDLVDIRLENACPTPNGPVSVAVADVNLGGSNNLVNVHIDGYDDVNFDGFFAGGDNRVEIGLLLPAVQKVREAAARVSLDFGGSNNQGRVSNQGWGKWEVNLAQALPLDDATAAATQGRSLFVISTAGIQPGVVPKGSVVFTIDGNPTAPGSDSFEVHGQGFGAATVEADTAGGSDSIWIDIDAPVLTARVHVGDGDDDVRVDSQPERWFSEGPAPINQLSIDTGAGDDTVHTTVLPSVTDLVLDPFSRSAIAIDSGEGNDNVFVQTRDVADLQIDVLTRAGDDTVVIDPAQSIVFVATGEGDADIDLDLGDGDDTAEISIDGYFNILLGVKAGTGNDNVGVKKLGSKLLILQGEGTYIGQHVDLGSGNYRLESSSEDVIHDATFVDAGDGNDTVVTRSNVTAVWLTVGFFEVATDVKTGAGDDKVSIHNEGIRVVRDSVDTGDGNDTVEMFESRPGVGILKSMDGGKSYIENLGTVTFTFTLGFGDDRAQINTIGYGEVNGQVDAGDGDDTIVSNSSPPSPGASPRPILIVIYTRAFFLGAGDDQLVIDTTGEDRSDIYIDAGAGNDHVKAKPLFAFLNEGLDNPTRLNLEVLLGAGDDRLEADTTGAGLADIRINGGDGDDEILTRHRMFAVVDRTKLNLVILLGAGDDTLDMETAGYRRVKTAINTGPAGDGRDSVSASHQSQRRSSRKHNVRMNLDGGRDVYRHTSKGYAVQKTVKSATSVEWVFVA